MDPNLDQDDDFIENTGLEVNLDDAEEIQIEIEDDTPPEDRNRKPLSHDPLESVDDEAVEYSAKVKKRMGELRHKAHDERRAREAAERERQEAIRVAKESYSRMKELERQLTSGEAYVAGEVKQKHELALKQAQDKHRSAYEAGDADKISEAIAEIAAAAQAKKQAEEWEHRATNTAKNALQQQDDDVDFDTSRNTKQNETVINPDKTAVAWTKRNPWFQKDKKMTALAFGVHEELIEEGLNPDDPDDAKEYYSRIDATMRERFPEYQWDETDTGAKKPPPKAPPKKSASVVAPVSRVPTGAKPNKVTLTKTQVAIARQLGVSLEAYAKELLKEQGA